MDQLESDQLPFPCKIDYYTGAQGNFLQLMLCLNSRPHVVDLSQPLFDAQGACHTIFDPEIQSQWSAQIGTTHFSQRGLPMAPSDRVVEIHVPKNYLLAVLVNRFVRAPFIPFDLSNPHVDSTAKLDQDLRKMQGVKQRLQERFGPGPDYALWNWRCLFYYDFLEPESTHNRFSHTGQRYIMHLDGFFNFDSFCQHLRDICEFFGMPFALHSETRRIWHDYMARNQGLQCKLRCDKIYQGMLAGQSMDLVDLNVLEQSWLIYRCFGHTPHLAMAWIMDWPDRSDQPIMTFNGQVQSEPIWLELARR